MNKIKIDLGDNRYLVAEANPEPDYREIFVYLEKDGVVHQDLAIVGQEYEYTNDGTKFYDAFSIKVYADHENEDFTDDFTVEEYKGE